MARLARIVVPDLLHHVTARGNRREPIFFEDGDQEIYLDLLAEDMRKARVQVGLLPDAQSCSPDRLSHDAERIGSGHGRGAQTVGHLRKCEGALAGTSV